MLMEPQSSHARFRTNLFTNLIRNTLFNDEARQNIQSNNGIYSICIAQKFLIISD